MEKPPGLQPLVECCEQLYELSEQFKLFDGDQFDLIHYFETRESANRSLARIMGSPLQRQLFARCVGHLNILIDDLEVLRLFNRDWLVSGEADQFFSSCEEGRRMERVLAALSGQKGRAQVLRQEVLKWRDIPDLNGFLDGLLEESDLDHEDREARATILAWRVGGVMEMNELNQRQVELALMMGAFDEPGRYFPEPLIKVLDELKRCYTSGAFDAAASVCRTVGEAVNKHRLEELGFDTNQKSHQATAQAVRQAFDQAHKAWDLSGSGEEPKFPQWTLGVFDKRTNRRKYIVPSNRPLYFYLLELKLAGFRQEVYKELTDNFQDPANAFMHPTKTYVGLSAAETAKVLEALLASLEYLYTPSQRILKNFSYDMRRK
ncbi:MAG: hypothetical protein EVA65_00915 [Oceanococcus sp.]|nr:MAG: hypothetical protein EVA65_00915 [Oceanococcus sp.]